MATTHLDPFTAARALAVLEDLIAGYSAARIALGRDSWPALVA